MANVLANGSIAETIFARIDELKEQIDSAIEQQAMVFKLCLVTIGFQSSLMFLI